MFVLLLYVPLVNSYGHCRRSVQLTTLFFLGKLEQAINQYFLHILTLNWQQSFLTDSGEGRRMTVDQSPRKYGTGPISNSRPLDLQSDSHLLPDTLQTGLRGPVQLWTVQIGKFCLFLCCFTSQSTAMVIMGWSVHLTTLFPGQAWTSSSPVLRAHTFARNWQPFLNDSFSRRKENDRRNYFMVNLHESMGPGRDQTRDSQ